jgi:hypothetical protein
MSRTNAEWVAQVSLLRPGFLFANGTPVQSLEVAALFSTDRAAYQRNPNVTGNMPTVPVPIPLAEPFGESTQT